MKVNRNNTHKKNIINNIYNKVGLPSIYAAKLVNDLLSILISDIITQKIFKIKNFGTFNLRKKKKRIGRNPKNNKTHEISERNVITFNCSEEFKKKINSSAR